MKPEEKCVSFETAKKLAEAGFPQDTERYWHLKIDGLKDVLLNELSFGLSYEKPFEVIFNRPDTKGIAAPDVQEIEELLPEEINNNTVYYSKVADNWLIEHDCDKPIFSNPKLSEAMAYFWLWLKENNLT